jgi:hypothetical protein
VELSWTEHGACDDNLNQMIQLLVTSQGQRNGEQEVTVVVGEWTTETKRIVDELRNILLVGHLRASVLEEMP